MPEIYMPYQNVEFQLLFNLKRTLVFIYVTKVGVNNFVNKFTLGGGYLQIQEEMKY